MSDIEIAVGDFWITKRHPIECEVTQIDVDDDTTWITSYSKDDDEYGAVSKHDFLRDYSFLRKGGKADMVNHPPHYKDASGIECIEVTKYMSFLGGNCFKYLYRAGKKGSTVEDLKKAAWYADYAWKMGEIVSVEAMELIDLIAEHRSGNIADAMRFIYEDHWAMVEQRIEAEIARLESE